MSFGFKNFWTGLRLVPSTTDTTSQDGDLQALTNGQLIFNNGSGSSPLITESSTDTLTNKTLTSPTINGGVITGAAISGGTTSGGTVTGSTLAGTTTNTGTITGGAITSTAISGSSITGGAIDPASLVVIDNTLSIENSSDNTKVLKFSAVNVPTTSTITLSTPSVSDTLVGISATQTLTNKTISTANNTLLSGSATAGQVLTADGAGNTSFATIASAPTSSNQINNLGLEIFTNQASANNLNVNIVTASGGTPSGASPVTISFPTAISAGLIQYTTASLTSALSLNVPSGSTFGLTSPGTFPLYIYAVDVSGVIHIGIASKAYDVTAAQNTTVHNITGGATILGSVYSDVTTGVYPVVLIGAVEIDFATPGVYNLAPLGTTLGAFSFYPPGSISGGAANGGGAINQALSAISPASISGTDIANGTIAAINIVNATITGTQLANNINLPGGNSLSNGNALVVASTSTRIQTVLAYVNSSNSLNFNNGIAGMSHTPGSGIYTFIYSTAFSVNPAVQVSAFSSGGVVRVAAIYASNGTGCTIAITDQSGSVTDDGFCLTVMGTF